MIGHYTTGLREHSSAVRHKYITLCSSESERGTERDGPRLVFPELRVTVVPRQPQRSEGTNLYVVVDVDNRT